MIKNLCHITLGKINNVLQRPKDFKPTPYSPDSTIYMNIYCFFKFVLIVYLLYMTSLAVVL